MECKVWNGCDVKVELIRYHYQQTHNDNDKSWLNNPVDCIFTGEDGWDTEWDGCDWHSKNKKNVCTKIKMYI